MAVIIFTDEQKQEILEALFEGKPLTFFARKFGVRQSDISKALKKDPAFKAQVEEARAHGLDVIVEGTLEFVDDYGDAHMARVKADIVWKYAACMNRAKYGEKIDMNVNQTVSIDLALQAAAGRIAPLLAAREVKELKPAVVDVTPKADKTKDDDIDSLL